ncbi:MAG: transcription termination/antitermination protein NusG [Eubacteriaceae bacterium]|nr:transcription termination/antitermination protein NusG [Eubacteriaceae bacterium]MDD4507834.1 transcription termination/antitermination protein NusG [Eubacteriaceae bacterium]
MEYENNDKAQWYVAHTYSGYENKVKASIEATVENRNMEDVILQVQVPTQEVIETKDGKKVTKEKKLFPGYVMVEMFMTDDSWYVVRNTRGVTGFVGPASKPVPLSPAELKSMGIKQQTVTIDIKVGDEVKVVDGPFEGYAGEVEEINLEKSKIRVNISAFGRETPMELDFEQIEKIKNT